MPDNQLCDSRTFIKQNDNTESSFRMSEFVKQSTKGMHIYDVHKKLYCDPKTKIPHDDPSNSILWYPEAMKTSTQQPILLTWRKDLLKSPKGEVCPLVQSKTLKLVAWNNSRLDYKRKKSQRRLPNLSLNQENQALTQVTSVLKRKLIHFVVIQTKS